MTESLLINSKSLSTADNFSGHDITYVRTDYVEIAPTTLASNWAEGAYIEHQVPAEPLAHDVMSESYYDLEWSIRLVIKAGSFLPRLVSHFTTTGAAYDPSNAAKADWHLHFGINPKSNIDYFNLLGVTDKATAVNYVENSTIDALTADIELPLPATSGFVPSQSFLHDNFDDLVFSGLNTNQIRTIESSGSGGFQYASKILEILDSCCPRFGTADVKSVKGRRDYYAYNPESTSVYNPYPMHPVASKPWFYQPAGSNQPGDFNNMNPNANPPAIRGLSADCRVISHLLYSGRSRPVNAIGSIVPSVAGYLTEGGPQGFWDAFCTDFLPGSANKNAYADAVVRYFCNSALSNSISIGQVVGYQVNTETNDPWHLCLTVGGEVPDPYTILDQTFRGIRLNDGRTGFDHSAFSATYTQPVDIVNPTNSNIYANPAYVADSGHGLPPGSNNPYVDSASYTPDGVSKTLNPFFANELNYFILPSGIATNGLYGQDFFDYYSKGLAPPPPNCSLWALAGIASSATHSSKSCAIYRAQLLTNKIRRFQASYFSDNFDPTVNPNGNTPFGGGTDACMSTVLTSNVKFQLYWNNLSNLISALKDTAEWNQRFRTAYRPKDGIFGIEYDMPAYSKKSFKLRRGPFTQSYCGDPLSDVQEWIDYACLDTAKLWPGVGMNFGTRYDDNDTYSLQKVGTNPAYLNETGAMAMPNRIDHFGAGTIDPGTANSINSLQWFMASNPQNANSYDPLGCAAPKLVAIGAVVNPGVTTGKYYWDSGPVMAGAHNMQIMRKLSPYFGTLNLQAAYKLVITKCNLRVFRHMLDNDSQTSIKRLIMEKGLAQYAVRHCLVQIVPIQQGLTTLNINLFENTPGDLILISIMRNQALLWNQSLHQSRVESWINNTLAVAANKGAPADANELANWTTRKGWVIGGIKARAANAKYIDSLCSAPLANMNVNKNEYVVNWDSSNPTVPAGSGVNNNAFLDINQNPTIPTTEIYITVNGQREPIVPYEPDPTTDSSTYVQNDTPYLQFVREMAEAGYPEVQSVVSKSVWNANVRVYAFNLTTSKFPTNGQGSNLAYRKTIGLQAKFQKPAEQGYSLIALSITQQSRLQMSASGSYNYLI